MRNWRPSSSYSARTACPIDVNSRQLQERWRQRRMPTLTPDWRPPTRCKCAPAHREGARRSLEHLPGPRLCHAHRSANRAVLPRMLLDMARSQALAVGTLPTRAMSPADRASADARRCSGSPLISGPGAGERAEPLPLNAVWIGIIRKRICKVTGGPHCCVRPS